MVTKSFEGLGVLVKRGLIDAELVDDLMSMYIIALWQKTGQIFKEMRVRTNSPTLAEYYEYLYDAVYAIWRREHSETLNPLSSQ